MGEVFNKRHKVLLLLFFSERLTDFFSYKISNATDMLPKISTHVNQNLGSNSMQSHLSVFIFIAPRNLLRLEQSHVVPKVPKRCKHVYTSPHWLVKRTIYYNLQCLQIRIIGDPFCFIKILL